MTHNDHGWLIAAVVMAGLMFALAFCTPAGAHHAANGMQYHSWCCGDGDCHSIPASAVREISGGFEVTLRPGDHPKVTRLHVFRKPYSSVLYSGPDGIAAEEFAACLYPNEDTLNCLYVPPRGV